MSDNKTTTENRSKGKAIPVLVAIQLLIAIVAVVVTVVVSLKIRPLIETKQRLEQEIAQLEKTRTDLEAAIDTLKKQKEFYADVLAQIPQHTKRRAVTQKLTSDPTAAQIVPRIYVHIRRETQREKAKRIADQLQKKGFLVPGVERLDTGPTDHTEVRYFRDDEVERREAARIVSILEGLNVNRVEAKYIPGYETRVERRRHYEIWFSPGALE